MDTSTISLEIQEQVPWGDCLIKVSLFLAYLVVIWWLMKLSGLLYMMLLELPAYKWKIIEDNYIIIVITLSPNCKIPHMYM